MFSSLSGTVHDLSPSECEMNCGGVGYNVKITLSTYKALESYGFELLNPKLYTHVAFREDDTTIYGFATKEERDMFRLLIGVSGIGGGTAQKILSAVPAENLASAIISGDEKALTTIKGIGAKMAGQIILDLKSKVKGDVVEATFEAVTPFFDDAVSSLVALGTKKSEASSLVTAAIKLGATDVTSAIRLALKK